MGVVSERRFLLILDGYVDDDELLEREMGWGTAKFGSSVLFLLEFI